MDLFDEKATLLTDAHASAPPPVRVPPVQRWRRGRHLRTPATRADWTWLLAWSLLIGCAGSLVVYEFWFAVLVLGAPAVLATIYAAVPVTFPVDPAGSQLLVLVVNAIWWMLLLRGPFLVRHRPGPAVGTVALRLVINLGVNVGILLLIVLLL